MVDGASLLVERKRNILFLSLNNPQKRNALNSEMMGLAASALENVATYPEIRLVVIQGSGTSFCSGADVNNWSPEELQALLSAIVNCPIPTVAVVHGVCLGGGMGLMCSCDFILAHEDTLFGFPEVRIGMVPAIISPYVNRKIGLDKMRELFLTGEKFGIAKASNLGFIYSYFNTDQDKILEALVSDLKSGAPHAQSQIKKLLDSDLIFKEMKSRDSELARFISEIKEGAESQEGIRSFLEKRKPSWSE